MFEKKQLAKKAIAPLAGAYVGYIVLNNLNLQINTVGFYQISKIAVAPAGKQIQFFNSCSLDIASWDACTYVRGKCCLQSLPSTCYAQHFQSEQELHCDALQRFILKVIWKGNIL